MSRLLLISVLVGVVCCKGSTAPLLPSPVGNYVLTTIDSKSLPAQENAGDSVLTGGAILYSNGSYAMNWLTPSYYFGTRSEIAGRDTGTWTGSTGQLSFTSSSGSSWSATFDAPSLTVHLTQDTWTFVKP